MRSSPPAPASQSGYGRDPSAKVNPLGLALCGLATLVALPVLFLGRGASLDIDASAASSAMGVTTSVEDDRDAPPDEPEATASSLLQSIDRQSLLDGGADPDAAIQLQQASSSSPSVAIVPSMPTDRSAIPARGSVAGRPPSPSAGNSVGVAPAPSANSAAASASSPATPSTAAPTTAAPTTAAPTTAGPTTAGPTTAAPTTAAPTTAAPTTAAPTTTPTIAAPVAPANDFDDNAPDDESAASAAGPSAADWEALRACESFGSYTIVSGDGLYHGAYQFSVATWNATANVAGRPDLVGVLPSAASAADQDALALNLWSRRGFAPWPHCSRGLG